MKTFEVEVYGEATVQAQISVQAENIAEAEAIAILRAAKLKKSEWVVRETVLADSIALTGEYVIQRDGIK